MLPPAKRDLLIKLLGMLGSAFEGERANAAAMVDKLMREHKLTWEQLLNGVPPGFAGQGPQPKPSRPSEGPTRPSGRADGKDDTPEGWAAMHSYACEHDGDLTEWELDFLESIGEWLLDKKPLSDKQKRVLRRIYAKAKRGF